MFHDIELYELTVRAYSHHLKLGAKVEKIKESFRLCVHFCNTAWKCIEVIEKSLPAQSNLKFNLHLAKENSS